MMRRSDLFCRASAGDVACETTALVHGVPRADAPELAGELRGIIESHGAGAAFIGLVHGRPTVGMSDQEIAEFIATADIPKANASNLGVYIHQGAHAATTVSTTMELAAQAGLRLFATGGLGGVHPMRAGEAIDVSADLFAFTRFPVAVVSSGVKSILDVESTRELLETLGVPVVGFGVDRFPAFYRRESSAKVDARFDEAADLAAFLAAELARTGRGVLVVNPIPREHELAETDWLRWLAAATEEARAAGAAGRDVTPATLARLHDVSKGATLRANVSLLKANADLAGAIARYLR